MLPGGDILESTSPLTCAFFWPYEGTAPKNQPHPHFFATSPTKRSGKRRGIAKKARRGSIIAP
jgi:hypothetical protein